MKDSSLLDELWEGYSVKVVAIDDDVHSLDILKRYIKVAYPDVQYFSADNGKDGLKLVNEKHPDLILLDIEMPEVSGLDVLKILKEQNSEAILSIPVIMITVVKDEVSIRKAIELGAVNYILKPYNRKDLIKRLKPYLIA
ncbi:PleD family two-component system response regulator [candidate division KSB1 bacterium]